MLETVRKSPFVLHPMLGLTVMFGFSSKLLDCFLGPAIGADTIAMVDRIADAKGFVNNGADTMGIVNDSAHATEKWFNMEEYPSSIVNNNTGMDNWLVDQYNHIMVNQKDPRVDDWLGMDSIWPTVGLCTLYYLIVRGFGPTFMANRPAYNVKTPMLCYNIFQAVFNGWLCLGAARYWFSGEYNWVCQGVDYTTDPKAMKALSLSWWFYMSKFPDFFDSFFFVLRHKPDQLTSLHVVHHATLPFFTWFGAKFAGGGNFLFGVMFNSGIHTLMYSYYFLAACGPQVRKFLWWKRYLTTAQIIQFICVITKSTITLFHNPCNFSIAIELMVFYNAGLYWVLFMDFYIKEYANKKAKTSAMEKSDSNGHASNGHISEHGVNGLEKKKVDDEEEKPMEIVWGNVIKFIILHSFALYGVTLLPSISVPMWIFLLITYQFSGAGITAGAHRLWAHKSYSARLPLRLFLAVANSMAGQNSIYVWSRDHRTHHKESETNGDPHNATRGFFFSHMGWLLCRKHPEVFRAGKTIDMSDLEADPMVMFQHRHYIPCMITACFILPSIIPNILWGESLSDAYFVAVLRYVSVLHFTWLVNSAAHLFGGKPYDLTIGPAENRVVSVLAMGEGHHNYHHVFPMDYATSEWGYSLNATKVFIDVMAWCGLAYNLKTTKSETIIARAKRTGIIEQTKHWKDGKVEKIANGKVE